MGSCFDADTRLNEQNKEINSLLKEEREQKWVENRFLLTGTNNSGKTTILKQLYLSETKDEYDNIPIMKRNNIINDIRQNCIDNIITLCKLNDDQKSIQLLQQLSINDRYNLSKIA